MPGRLLQWALPLGLLLALFLIQLLAPTWFRRPEAWTEDLRFYLRGSRPPHSPITILALDEDSFQMFGDLSGENIRTWPRARWAELVSRIAAGQPQLIILDIVFDTPGWDPGGDPALAQALAQAGNVLLAANLEPRLSDAGYQNLTFSTPIAPLATRAAGFGISSFPLDADSNLRAARLLWSWGGQTFPALGLLAASTYLCHPVQLSAADLGADLSLPLNFRGPEGAYTTYSLIELWNGDLDPAVFADQIVVVGYTTLLEQDRHPTPFGGKVGLPGVEIHATLIDNLLAGDWLSRPPAWLSLLLISLAALLAWLLITLAPPTWGVLAWLVSGILYSGFCLLLFNRFNLLLSQAAPSFAALLVGGATLAERMVFAEQDKRLLRQRFSGMMAPERLQAVMQHWEALRDPSRPAQHAAVLFADVRNFTQATETLMRQGRNQEMTRFLNAYLDAMSQAVYQTGGVIYRVIGDGLLILFGLPDPVPDPEWRAAQCAFAMSQASLDLQSCWPLQDELPFGMGIGVHAGLLVDVIVGSGRRIDYVIIGDAANTAARIEGLCKEASRYPISDIAQGKLSIPSSVTILLSQEVHQAVWDRIHVDDSLPPFPVRGKAEPLHVVRLLGIRSGDSP